MSDKFQLVTLPRWRHGGDRRSLESDIAAWIDSAPLRVLAEMSGWEWPATRSPLELAGALAALSDDWDFRVKRNPQSQERNYLADGGATVRGRTLDREQVEVAAQALGLVDSVPVASHKVDHLVVLSGLVKACVNRTRYAAALMREGLEVGTVSVLAGHRHLTDPEREDVIELGYEDIDDEALVAVAATMEAFQLGAPASSRTAPSEDHSAPAEWNFRSGAARHTWPGVEILVVPSSEPATRRVNTPDQLRYWAEHAAVGPEDEVLLVNTQIYVPFQHMDAIRILGLARQCGVTTIGVDPRTASIPLRTFGAESYLQEIRSALRSAVLLLQSLQGTP